MRRDLPAMASTEHDLVIVGGGITGAAIARDAAMRGLKVALLEARDFSHGTSAATSKLVHGGLRYLKSLEFALVRESLAERRIWQRIAPHLVYPLPFLLPVKSRSEKLFYETGLALYDLLSFDRNRQAREGQHMPGHRGLAQNESLAQEPVLAGQAEAGALRYFDCQMFAPERLGLECIIAAAEHGAHVANYAQGAGIHIEDGRIRAVAVHDHLDGARHIIRARMVINAAGPGADLLLAQWGVSAQAVRLVRSRGAHILTRALTQRHALALPVDGGHLFVLPWRGLSLIGPTDTVYEGDVNRVAPAGAEIEALLATANRALPAARLTAHDVVHAYAGLRPLIAEDDASSYRASRRSELIDHAKAGGPDGLLSAIGGKWTTSRRLAEESVDLVLHKLSRPALPSKTAQTALPGGSLDGFDGFAQEFSRAHPALQRDSALLLARLYGSRAPGLVARGGDDGSLPLAPNRPEVAAQIRHAVEAEMALRLDDVVFRRTGLGTAGHPGRAALEMAARLMGQSLGWDERERCDQIAAVEAQFPIRRAPP